MKRILIAGLLTFISVPAYGNEIAGTRVLGQGAICAEGQGKAVEYNIALKQESSYCYELAPVIPPTQEQLETKVKQEVAQTITEQKNQNPVTVVAETPVTAEIEPVTETVTAIEVNATTQVVTERELTQAEKDQLALDRARYNAERLAREQAEAAAKAEQGSEQCVNWEAAGASGQECAFEPISATEEEVQEQYDFLYNMFSFNWFAFLELFVWNL